MNYNYHTHTKRCGHAVDDDEEYIKRAILCGMKYMGFSDHFPFRFPCGYESPHRVPLSEAKEYIEALSGLREKYRDKIEIRIGFEMEYYPTYFKDMVKSAVALGAEYLIMGHHFLHEEYPDNLHVYHGTDSVQDLEEYVSSVIDGIKSGVFTYAAHPDMLKFKGDVTLFEEGMRKICIASREYNVPLELNFLGIRDNRNYPNEKFWKIAGEEKSPVTFGLDAHDSKSAYDEEALIKAKETVKKYKLNYIGKPELVLIQNIKL